MKSRPARDGLVVAIDLGATKTSVMIFDPTSGSRLADCRLQTDNDAGPDATLASLRACALELLSAHGRAAADVAAVGVAVPGWVDHGGRVVDAGKLAGWTDLPLRERLERDWNVPAFVEQDGNAGALGEMWQGAARGLTDFVFLALGTGIGAGLVLGGKVHRGAHHAAGEVGDAVPGRFLLGRGEPGAHNLAGLIGGEAIRTAARAAVGEWLSAAESIQKADQDPRLADLAERVADYVALAIIHIQSLIDPEAILLGGGTASAGRALLDRVYARVQGELRVQPTLLLAGLGEAAQLYGATWGAIEASNQRGGS